MKLKLNKKIIEDKNLSNNAILSYIGLVACSKLDYNPIFINRSMISYYLTGNTKPVRRFDESLKLGLKELIDNKVIDCYEQNSTNYYFGTKNIRLEQEDIFVFVDFDDVRKIMQCDYHGKICLLRFYIATLGTFLSKNKIIDIRDPEKYNNVLGTMSQEYLANLIGISLHTSMEYTKILEQLELLYISRCSYIFKDKKGNFKRHNNIYGNYKNKEIIDDYMKVRYEMYDELHKVHTSKAANNSRSLIQKYNQMVRGHKYDNETVKDIYDYICKYNKEHSKNCKDMSVFVQYGYNIDDYN